MSIAFEERCARFIIKQVSNLNPQKAELLKARRAAPKGLKGRSSSPTRREETIVHQIDGQLGVLQSDILIIIGGAGADVRQFGGNQLIHATAPANPISPAIDDDFGVNSRIDLHRHLQLAQW